MLDVRGCLVTIDAMGTQRVVASKTLEGDGDFLLQVKGNQKKLLQACGTALDPLVDGGMEPDRNHQHACSEEKDTGRPGSGSAGRLTDRSAWGIWRRSGPA